MKSPSEPGPTPEEVAAPYVKATYPQHGPYCDIVMKGGVTSGVVYPLAICALAKNFIFRNIGGTSAGAIASALAAAAEFDRRNGPGAVHGTGFAGLAGLPVFLATNKGLLNLFQPSSKCRPLFEAALRAVEGKPIPWIVFTALRSYWKTALVPVAVVAAASALVVLNLTSGPLRWLMSVVGLGATLLTAAVFTLFGLWRTLRAHLPENFFGMCSGIDQIEKAPPLTTWLDNAINAYAGVQTTLTFGDLWNADAPNKPGTKISPYVATGNRYLDDIGERATRSINLEMVTTNATMGRPYRLPFSDLNQYVYYFDRNELARLFPPAVVRHLVAFADKRYASSVSPAGTTILPLPPDRDFPVIVAARMSLSFPLLFSAIPLYAADRNDPGAPPQKCWFSDGGISSNLPAHFFDNPLTRWPTFALNLRNPTPTEPRPVAMADAHTPDINEIAESGGNSIGSFLAAVLDAMQNWNDNMLLQLPGYKERVVEVQLDASQGGLNLNMPASTITALMQQGAEAGNLLVSQFSPTTRADAVQVPAPRWAMHRNLRIHSSLGHVSQYARAVQDANADPQPPDGNYFSILQSPESIRVLKTLTTLARWLQGKAPVQDPLHTAPIPGPELKPRGRQ